MGNVRRRDDAEGNTKRATTASLFKGAGYTNIPNCYLTPEYIQQVGSDGLLFIAMSAKAYDNGVHKNGLSDGQFALSDQDMADWLGCKTTAPVRNARTKVLRAKPAFFSDSRPGSCGCAYEYQIRHLTAADRIGTPPNQCVGLRWRKRKKDRNKAGSLNTSMLNGALSYCGKEYSVIPLLPRGKEPHLKTWAEHQHLSATREQIQDWWKRWPDANVAIVTGAVSDLVVIDVDGPIKDGEDLLRQHGVILPDTTRVQTNRGAHYYFRHPGGLVSGRTAILSSGDLKIDIRGDGNYVVAPPSIHPNGTRYTLAHDVAELPVLPEALRSLCAKNAEQKPQATHRRDADEAGEGTRRIPNEMIAALRERTDIVELIESYGLQLDRKNDDNYESICPFHDDHNPSLRVTRSKGLWHCFGCDTGGDAIGFVMRKEGIGFPKAFKALQKFVDGDATEEGEAA